MGAPIDDAVEVPLQDWRAFRATADQHRHPATLPDLGWYPARVPGCAAQIELMADAPDRVEEFDWWYGCTFDVGLQVPGLSARLSLEGLATLAEVWLNNELILKSDNMFSPHVVNLDTRLQERANELAIRFVALAPALKARDGRGRGRWRSTIVEDQGLRWVRTSLLGRVASLGQMPPIVGPWRPVKLWLSRNGWPREVSLKAELDGTTGCLTAAIDLELADGRRPVGGTLIAGDVQESLTPAGDGLLRATVRIPEVVRWMPHTHGSPALYQIGAQILLTDGSAVGLALGRTGFRVVDSDAAHDLALSLNDIPVFFRGGCWMPLEGRRLGTTPAEQYVALRQLRDSGANMVRVSGTFLYEDAAFYAICDELGIAVWQDFMFAGLDYPFDDDRFRDSAVAEASAVLCRLAQHPCVAVLCGNTEVSQQAAMLGLPVEDWSNGFFDATLPELVAERMPGTVYRPSSPSGGALPMQPDQGDSHYQGVGAYRRQVSDSLLSGVRFASETLTFANVPQADGENAGMSRKGDVLGPRWKSGTPRDRGAGWDFDDIRDFYLPEMFGVDPLDVRYSDPDRYLQLARSVTGEVMRAVFANWRHYPQSSGGLVWLWRDLTPGAGWGVIACDGLPKPAYFYLKRAWRSPNVLLIDRGMNGLWVTAVNDGPAIADLIVRLRCYAGCDLAGMTADWNVSVPAHGLATRSVEDLLGGFVDLNHVYRFGPRTTWLVHAELLFEGGHEVVDDFFYPGRANLHQLPRTALRIDVVKERGAVLLNIGSDLVARAVEIAIPGYVAADNYFDLAPGSSRTIELTPVHPKARTFGTVSALNATSPTRVTICS